MRAARWGGFTIFCQNHKPHIIILGAGPAGLGAAFQLTRRGVARVSVIEKNDWVGGIAGSFELSGITVDYGSHRLHHACDPKILQDIRSLLGNDLLNRPRHGRIRLRERWIDFPLRPLKLLLGLPPGFAWAVMADLFGKWVGRQPGIKGTHTFASVVERNLGRTICREFYFPYARKLWGVPPQALSAVQAQRRISANSMRKIFKKALSGLAGLRPHRTNRFYYPRRGFGQISEGLYQAARDRGARFYLGTRVKSIRMIGETGNQVHCERDGAIVSYVGDHVWSTIPIPELVQCLGHCAPPSVMEVSQRLEYRSMVLIYLVLEQDRFSQYDAHYFPEPDVPISRISEPKNYNNACEPRNQTVLCAELPCSPADPAWLMTDADLGNLVCDSMGNAGIPVKAPVKKVVSRRLHQAYPVYRQGFERFFGQIDAWLSRIDNLLTFGRQGLFFHDNTHLALYMAYAAVDCFGADGSFDFRKWRDYRKGFESHVVED